MNKLLVLAFTAIVLAGAAGAQAHNPGHSDLSSGPGSAIMIGNRAAVQDAALRDMAQALSTPSGSNLGVEDNPLRLLDDDGSRFAGGRDPLRQNVLEFDSMVGIPAELAGTDLLRGVPGGGLPWTIGSARGELGLDGRLDITVNGLVLANEGTNPSPAFGAVVSCEGTGGAPANVSTTGTFPADEAGNATIQETVALPSPCLAPLVFVTGTEGQWFAVTGVMGAGAATTPATGANAADANANPPATNVGAATPPAVAGNLLAAAPVTPAVPPAVAQ